MDEGNAEQIAERVYFRTRNTVAWGILSVGDDSKKVQNHQVELYQDETRNGVNRIQQFGISTMPLPGSRAMVVHHGGARSLGTVVAVEHADYRPIGLQPGETHGYMVDGAGKDGTGGTMRSLWKGTLGWVHSIFGKTINVGDTNSSALNVSGSSSFTITITGHTVNITGTVGDVVVNGISLVHHVHPDPQGGVTGPPQ